MTALLSVEEVGPSTIHERVVHLLELLASRMQWSAARVVISDAGLHVSRGWHETVKNVRSTHYSELVLNGACARLSEVMKAHALVGNKRVSFFDLRDQAPRVSGKLLEWANSRALKDLAPILAENQFSVLDAPTDQRVLEQMRGNAPRLISAEKHGEQLKLQFFATRAYSHRESVDIDRLVDQGVKYLAEYNELIGVKTRWIPCFDTVVIDSGRGLVEFRVDFAPGLSGDKDHSALGQVMSEFDRFLVKFVGVEGLSAGLMNFYPAIDPLYRDQACGRVTALGFVATSKDSSSNNHGQIHRTKTQDFRKDRFHLGGVQRVDKIEPYAIGVTWAPSLSRDLVLEIKGSVKALYGGKSQLVNAAEIVGCLGESDYEFVTEQILTRVPRRKP